MNNFLTRLVTRSSTKLQNTAGSSVLVKPRIGSRFESSTGLSSEAYQAGEVEDNKHYSRIADNELQPQNRQLNEGNGKQDSSLLKNNHPVTRDSGDKTNKLNEATHFERDVGNPDENVSTRQAPPVVKTNEVMTPDSLPVISKGTPEVSSLDDGINRNPPDIGGNKLHSEHSDRSLSDQFPQTTKPAYDISAQAPSVADSSNTGHPVLTPEISAQIVQTKTLEPNSVAMPGKTNATDIIKPSRPILSGTNQHEQSNLLSESISHDLPMGPDMFTAKDDIQQIVKQDVAESHENTKKTVTSIINTRINLLDSRESTQTSPVFSDSSNPDAPIIHSNDVSSRSTDHAGRNSMAAISPNAQTNEPAQPPTVKVSIGRIEIRANTPAPQPVAAPQRPRRGPAVSLGDYLKSKGG